MTEESPSKIKIKKVLKNVDTVVRLVLTISITIALYIAMKFAGAVVDSQPILAILIGTIVINSLISLLIAGWINGNSHLQLTGA